MTLTSAVNYCIGCVFAEREPPGKGCSTLLMGIAILLVMVPVLAVLGLVGFFHWLIVDGLLFVALWALPRRHWPWVFLAAIVARIAAGVIISIASGLPGAFLGYWSSPISFLLGNVLEPFLVVTGVLLLQHWRLHPGGQVTTASMAKLHFAAAVSAFAVACKDIAYVLNENAIGDVRQALIVNMVAIEEANTWGLLSAFAIKNFLGCFVGIMLLAPFALWAGSGGHRRNSSVILKDGMTYLLLVMIGYLVLATSTTVAQLAEFLRLLLMVATAIFAMRHGWRGAAMSIFTASMAIAIEDHIGQPAHSAVWMQLFIAITGAMALLFGATIDDMHEASRMLQSAKEKSENLASELHSAAMRNLQVEESERRRLAAELHDEFGQNMTALQTHLKLARSDENQPETAKSLDAIGELTDSMRSNIAGILERLQPAALEELGLYGAVDRGSIRRLAEDAGLHFAIELQGDARLLRLLEDSTRIAAYRLVQEAVTNVIRHARATQCGVRLRINRRGPHLWLFLSVRDNGLGRADFLRAGNGIRGMRARLLALGGKLHLSDHAPGLRLHALLRQAYTD